MRASRGLSLARIAFSRGRARLGLVLTLLLPASVSTAQEWTRFRGPNGSGLAEDTGIPVVWTEADYHWRIELPGIGHSCPVLWGDKLFVTSATDRGRKRLLHCIDINSGKALWTNTYRATADHIHAQNSYASSTPTVDDERVYTIWASADGGHVLALTHDGEEAWRVPLDGFASEHGYGASPILFEDLLIIDYSQDGEEADDRPGSARGESSWIAFDRHTGKRRWTIPRRSTVVAYATPCLYQQRPKLPWQIIFFSRFHGMSSVDPHSGQVNWEIEVFDKRPVASPLVTDQLIFGSCGSGAGGNYLVAVKPGLAPSVAYRITKSAPYVPTPVAREPWLFVWSDQGVVSCLETATGKRVWQKRVGGNYRGSPVCIGERIYCISMDGEVVVIAADSDYQLLGRMPLGEASHSTPAVAGGRIYLRTESHLISLGGKKSRTISQR